MSESPIPVQETKATKRSRVKKWADIINAKLDAIAKPGNRPLIVDFTGLLFRITLIGVSIWIREPLSDNPTNKDIVSLVTFIALQVVPSALGIQCRLIYAFAAGAVSFALIGTILFSIATAFDYFILIGGLTWAIAAFIIGPDRWSLEHYFKKRGMTFWSMLENVDNRGR